MTLFEIMYVPIGYLIAGLVFYLNRDEEDFTLKRRIMAGLFFTFFWYPLLLVGLILLVGLTLLLLLAILLDRKKEQRRMAERELEYQEQVALWRVEFERGGCLYC
jgi:predicted membrane protein